MSYFKRIKTNDLYLPFFEKVQQLQANCLERGAHYYAISGYRSVQEQDDLYALGRTVKNPTGASSAKPLGNIVTKAKGGWSYHNFQIAIDFALDGDLNRAGLQPDWKPLSYEILVEEALKLGLEPGGNWTHFKDWPHVQLSLSSAGLSLADLRAAYYLGGQQKVVALLDQHKW